MHEMNSKYDKMFGDASRRSQNTLRPEHNNFLLIDPDLILDHDHIRRSVANDLSDGVATNTWQLAGRCYLVARELSYILFDLKIPHAITIGNVSLDGRPYFSTTLNTLSKEFAVGYVPSTPANAHCWITLSNGSVLDASLAPSIAHREGQDDPLSFYDAVLVAPHGLTKRLEYEPLLTGFHYHFNVVTHPFLDRHYRTYTSWVEHFQMATRLSWWTA
jgi:hypothetical protein